MKSNNLIKQNVMKRPKPQVVRDRCNYFRNLLNRQFNQHEPNKVWVSDLLEINLSGVKYYLCVILDLFARKVLSWRIAHRKSDNLTINAIKEFIDLYMIELLKKLKMNGSKSTQIRVLIVLI